jgi:hypothetical protein
LTTELGETLEVVSSTTLFLQNPGTHYFDEVIFFDGILNPVDLGICVVAVQRG